MSAESNLLFSVSAGDSAVSCHLCILFCFVFIVVFRHFRSYLYVVFLHNSSTVKMQMIAVVSGNSHSAGEMRY